MKTRKYNIQAFLVQTLSISNKTAKSLIENGLVKINGSNTYPNQVVLESDEITKQGKVIKHPLIYKYYAYYKPRGIECTLNTNIQGNLLVEISHLGKLFPIGRLDKESEGLLLLTDNGSIYNKLVHSDSFKEKEYEVEVNSKITDSFLYDMGNGVSIMGVLTRKCQIWKISDTKFGIILTQGLNRQIRRMCYKLGYEVLSLKRVRINHYRMGDLMPGEAIKIELNDIGNI